MDNGDGQCQWCMMKVDEGTQSVVSISDGDDE